MDADPDISVPLELILVNEGFDDRFLPVLEGITPDLAALHN